MKLFTCLPKSIRGRTLVGEDMVDKLKDFLLLSSAEQDTQDTSRCFHFYVQSNLKISSFVQRLFFSTVVT